MFMRTVVIMLAGFLHVAMGKTGNPAQPSGPKDEALAHLRQAAIEQQTNAVAWLELGVASWRSALLHSDNQGSPPSASSFDEALHALEEGLRVDAHNFKLHEAIARVYEWRARFKSFNRDRDRHIDLQKALHHNSLALSNCPSRFATTRIKEGISLVRQLMEAERAVDTQAEFRNRDSVDAHPKGDVKRQNPAATENENDRALSALRSRLKLKPDNTDAWHEYGTRLVLQHLNDKQESVLVEAQEVFEKIIRLDPQYIAAYVSLGHVFDIQGSLTNALKYYKTALEMEPKRTYLRTAIDRIEAQLASKPKDLGGQAGFAQTSVIDGVVEDLRKRAQAEVNNSKAQSEYASVLMGVEYYNKGNKNVLPQVQKILEKAIQLDPKNGHAYEFLGHCLEAQGQYAPALANYRQAVIHGHDTQFIRSRIEAITRILNDN